MREIRSPSLKTCIRKGSLIQDWNREDDTREKEPYGKECEDDIEGLADDIEPENLAALHLLGDGLEIGVEADAGEGEHESPVLELVEDFVDGTNVFGSKSGLNDE